MFLPINTSLSGIIKIIVGESCTNIRIEGSVKQFEEVHNTLSDYIKNNNQDMLGISLQCMLKDLYLVFWRSFQP